MPSARLRVSLLPLLLVLSSGTVSRCDLSTEGGTGELHLSGTVGFSKSERGCWRLETDEGRRYELRPDQAPARCCGTARGCGWWRGRARTRRACARRRCRWRCGASVVERRSRQSRPAQVVERPPGPEHLPVVAVRELHRPSARPHRARHQLRHVGHLGQGELHLEPDRRREHERRVPPAAVPRPRPRGSGGRPPPARRCARRSGPPRASPRPSRPSYPAGLAPPRRAPGRRSPSRPARRRFRPVPR